MKVSWFIICLILKEEESIFKNLWNSYVYLVTQSYLILCDPTDCSLLGSSSMGILQARIMEWVAMPSSRGSTQPRDWTQVSHRADRLFTVCATREAQNIYSGPTYN